MYWPVIFQGRTLKVIAAFILLATLVAGGFYLHHSGYRDGYLVAEQKGQLELANYRAVQQSALDKIAAENRKTEDTLQTRMLQNYVEKEREIQTINDTAQRMLGSLRNRPARGTGGEPAANSNPAAPAAQCPREACSGKELSREDGEFLIGEAADADTLRSTLNSCRDAYERAYKLK